MGFFLNAKLLERLVCFKRREKSFGNQAVPGSACWIPASGRTPLPCWRPLDSLCTEQSTMPFLHGFRRIIFEYQPLVDEILGLLAIQDAEQQSALER